MSDNDLALSAHLMRRAGFGSTRSELDHHSSKNYETLVEELLTPERFPEIEEDILQRYYPDLIYQDSLATWAGRWVFRMVNSVRPLEEKMALFWHQVFATGWFKSEHTPTILTQIETFRLIGLSDMRRILLELSRDPSMVFWLDNSENHKTEPNENYGRELLELFSMGVGNYSEQDIKEAARAFTGWTFTQPIPLYPYGHYESEFEYRDEDHDNGPKTFLGETGHFNGEEIIDIIVKQPATARFISRHLYNFFVADEPPVSSWNQVSPQDPEAIEELIHAYQHSNGEIREILRVLFNSDFFKKSRYNKVKSPAELVAGTIKLVGTHRFPEPGLQELDLATTLMGQQLMNPPTVEGWHTGAEWINGGTLNERVNFAVNQMSGIEKPGIREITEKLSSSDTVLSPEKFVRNCLDLMGSIEMAEETKTSLIKYAAKEGQLSFKNEGEREKSTQRIGRMLQLIVASREYQLA